MYYILEGKIPKKVPVEEWVFQDPITRIVNKTNIENIEISTVFLGLDHSYNNLIPLLFETMIFGGDFDQMCWRYSTYEEAENGHKNAVRQVKSQESSLKGWRNIND